jgi:hypothetical protein
MNESTAQAEGQGHVLKIHISPSPLQNINLAHYGDARLRLIHGPIITETLKRVLKKLSSEKFET